MASWRVTVVTVMAALVIGTAGCQAPGPSLAAKTLSGLWYEQGSEFSPNTEAEFSWGRSPVAANSTLAIDALGRRPNLSVPVMGGPFQIRAVEEVQENEFRLRFSFGRGGFDVEYLVRHDPKLDRIWFSAPKFYQPIGSQTEVQTEASFLHVGPDRGYRRVGGPPR